MSEMVWTIHLLPYGMTKLPQFQLRESEACIKSELAAISAVDERLGFRVALGAHNTSQVADRDFPIYLVQANRFSSAITLARGRMPEYFDQNPAALASLSRQLQIESAATVCAEGKSISFVTIDKYLPPEDRSGALQAQKRLGRELAHTILHELGHCMGLATDDYYDDLMKPGFPGRTINDRPQPALSFRTSTRGKIVNWLSSQDHVA